MASDVAGPSKGAAASPVKEPQVCFVAVWGRHDSFLAVVAGLRMPRLSTASLRTPLRRAASRQAPSLVCTAVRLHVYTMLPCKAAISLSCVCTACMYTTVHDGAANWNMPACVCSPCVALPLVSTADTNAYRRTLPDYRACAGAVRAPQKCDQ
jgi:hypothetical protein